MLTQSLKVKDWRKLHNITGYAWRQMVRLRTGPTLLVIGPRTALVTPESDAEWIAKHQAEPEITAEASARGAKMQAGVAASQPALPEKPRTVSRNGRLLGRPRKSDQGMPDLASLLRAQQLSVETAES